MNLFFSNIGLPFCVSTIKQLKIEIMTDQLIIETLKKGQYDKVLNKLYESYPTVRSFISKNGGNEEDVKDVFQDALTIFFQKASNQDFVLSSKISTYLFSVSKYIWKDRLKQKNKFIYKEEWAESVLFEEEIEDLRDEVSLMNRIFEQLGEGCQKLLNAFYILKLTMAEISKEFSYSNSESAKNQKYKCLERAKSFAKELSNQTSKSF